jgi:hypothetical protein
MHIAIGQTIPSRTRAVWPAYKIAALQLINTKN